MHGRMWCPQPRPPRTLPDGTSECDWIDEPTPRDQLNEPGTPGRIAACYGWPHRTSDEPYVIIVEAFPRVLNNCHHQCKAPACE